MTIDKLEKEFYELLLKTKDTKLKEKGIEWIFAMSKQLNEIKDVIHNR